MMRHTRLEPLDLESRLAPAGLAPLTDINAAIANVGATPSAAAVFNGVLYFAAGTPTLGVELWKTDGTATGTALVKDINAGMLSGTPRNFHVHDGVLYFNAVAAASGAELWKTDGTATGTVLVRDINPGATQSDPRLFTSVGSTLYFVANDGTHGSELWKTDGTSSGTTLVADIRPTGDSAPSDLFNAAGQLLFGANDGVNGRELWTSDGTSASLVYEFRTGPGNGQPRFFVSFAGKTYFSANDGVRGEEFWQTDGTSAGTSFVFDFDTAGSNSSVPDAYAFNGKLYIDALTASLGRELWMSDGTASGTALLADISPGPGFGQPTSFVNDNGTLLFLASSPAGDNIHRTDSTSSGTTLVYDINPASNSSINAAKNLTRVGSKFFFTANSPTAGIELWTTDGTSAGTQVVRDLNPGLAHGDPKLLAEFNGSLYFSANNGSGFELWKSDGTSAGTTLVADLVTTTHSSNPAYLTNVNGTVFFTANNSIHGTELWKSDGSSTGTTLVRDIFPGIENSFPEFLTSVGSTLYFRANSGELWKSDGTSAGTVELTPPGMGVPRDLFNHNGTLFFTASGGGSVGYELWKTNGTPAGTVLVCDIFPGSTSSNPKNFISVGGTLYFRARDAATRGYELWKSNGTSSGTTLVKEIGPGSVDGLASQARMAAAGGLLFFAANDGVNGTELWRSDGTSAGTTLVLDIATGTSSSPGNLATLGNRAIFTATTALGTELWISDGTSSGTSLLMDIQPGSLGSAPTSLLTGEGRAFFLANDGATGFEVWTSDGTSTGTHLLEDITPGPAPASVSPTSAIPRLLAIADGVLYFNATDDVHGQELWRSDGTVSGTALAIDVIPGPGGSGPGYLPGFGTGGPSPINAVAANGRIFFAGTSDDKGRELYRYAPRSLAAIASASPNGVYTTGQTVTLTVQFLEPVTLTGGNLILSLSSGGTAIVTPFSGTSTTATYTVLAGETSPDLDVLAFSLAPGAQLIDPSGNAASLTLPALSLAAQANLIINPLAPTTVSAISINLGDPQRSRVTAIQLNFAAPVNAALLAGAITLNRTTGSPFALQTGISIAPATGMVSSLTLTFDAVSGVESGSLSDGRWRVSIPYLQYVSPEFHRLFGDVNGDATVDGGTDFAAFGNVFGTTVANSPFDFNADGVIDGPVDFAQFGARFGTTI